MGAGPSSTDSILAERGSSLQHEERQVIHRFGHSMCWAATAFAYYPPKASIRASSNKFCGSAFVRAQQLLRMISTKSSRTNVGSKCLSTSALIVVGDLEVSITLWMDVLASSCSIGHLDSANPPLPVGADSGPNVGVRVDPYGLNWSRGVGARCGPRASAMVRPQAGSAGLSGWVCSELLRGQLCFRRSSLSSRRCMSLPDELIHPGDLPRRFEHHEQRRVTRFCC